MQSNREEQRVKRKRKKIKISTVECKVGQRKVHGRAKKKKLSRRRVELSSGGQREEWREERICQLCRKKVL